MVEPNFLVLGAEKSGTTWLYNKLSEHPEIYLPLTKECHFFNRYNSNLEENNNYTELGWSWYRRFFENAPEMAKSWGEVTPMYLCDPEAPERIARDLPDIKLIYILRNPITRAYCHYWMAYRKGHTNKTFEEIVADKDPRFIKRGLYASQLQKYHDLFPANNIRGFIHEHFFDQPYEGLNNIYNFLDVSLRKKPENKNSNKVHGAPKPKNKFLHNVISKTAKSLRKNKITFGLLDWFKKTGIAPAIKHWNLDSEPYPSISKAMYNKLLEYYMPDINKLETEFGLNVDDWKK
jgi:hypothetical protein